MAVKAPGAFRVIGRSIVDWWDSMMDWVVIMFVWLLAQVTVVFGPPATFGLYSITNTLILGGESQGVRGLYEESKKYFGKAWVWGGINLAVIFLWLVNLQFYGQINALWAVSVQAILVLAMVLWQLTQFYALPYYMELKEPRLRTALRNGLMTALASPFFSAVMLLFVVVVGLLCLTVVLPIIFGFTALIPILGTRAMLNRLEAFGVREPEKDPKELEREKLSKIAIPEQRDQKKGLG